MSTELEVDREVIAVHGPFELLRTGVRVSEVAAEPTEGEWTEATAWVMAVAEASPWWRAAMIEYGESNFGEKYTQAVEATGLAIGTLMNEVYVARQIPISRRREKVPFALHQEVAPLPPDEQELWLDKIEAEGLTRAQVRAQIAASKETAAAAPAPVTLWLVVSCLSAEDQTNLWNRMTAEGRAVKMRVEQTAPVDEGGEDFIVDEPE